MSETIRVVLGISRRLNDLPEAEPEPDPERDSQLEAASERLRTLLAAQKSWAEEMERLAELVSRRPDLYPIRVPADQMPDPDEFRHDGGTACWQIPGTPYKLAFIRSQRGWGVYDSTGVLYDIGHLDNLDRMVADLSG